MSDHVHEPMPDELPRDWADIPWDQWVERSGTNDSSRDWTFYREDLSWVYGRVIKPLEIENASQAAQIAALSKRIDSLETGGISEERAREIAKEVVKNTTLRPPK